MNPFLANALKLPMPEFLRKIVAAWQLVAKRSLSQWRLLSALVIGVVLASAVMAGTVIYFDSLRELALDRTLKQHPITKIDILSRVERGPTNRVEHDLVSEIVNSEVDRRVSWLLRDRHRVGKTATFFLTPPGQEELAGEDNARTYFAFLPELLDRAEVVQGALPSEQPVPNPDVPLQLEALVPFEPAQTYGVQVGDVFSAVPHWDDRIPYVSVVVSGVVKETDPGAEYWHVQPGVLDAATGPSFRTVPFYISESTFLDVLGPAFLSMDSVYAWLLAVEPSRLNAGNARLAQQSIQVMGTDLSTKLVGFSQDTALVSALIQYDRRIFFSKLPMFVVLILIALVVLYYVATLSSLTVEQRKSEVALLRSRGATSAQILAVFVLEGMTIAVLAIALGPLLAGFAVGVLGYTPAFAGLAEGGPLPVSISGGSYLMSALGGVLSLVALIIPAVQASRISVTQHRQQSARPSALPAFQKYYADVLLLVVGLLLFRQLTEQGSVVATKLFGEVLVDQLLLAVPGIILVASAMVLLRLFPLAMSLASRLLSRALPAGLAIGVWQMSRNPTHYARLSLLIILAAGLGIFASSFGATLEKSFEERIFYATGSEIRIDGARLNTKCVHRATRRQVREGFNPPGRCATNVPLAGPVGLGEAHAAVDGVVAASAVLRARGQDLSIGFGRDYEMLAVDTATFADVAWFREDFADTAMTTLIESLTYPDPLQGIRLPNDSATIAVRIKADRPQPSVRVTARMRNGQNRFSSYSLGFLTSGDWMVLEADLEYGLRQSREFDLPLEIVAFGVHQTAAGADLRAGSLLIDEIRVRTTEGVTVVLETLEDTSAWTTLKTAADAIADKFVPADPAVGNGSAAIMSWADGRALINRGIFHSSSREPVPILASKSFATASGHGKGAEFDASVSGHRVPVRILDVIDLFPTMTSLSKSFIIADLTSLTDYANAGALFRELTPNEVWLATEAKGAERQALVNTLETDPAFLSEFVFDREQRLGEADVDPLVSAGWRALLFLAFATVLILSCLGFLVHAYVSFRNRELEFALLRTAGFSMKQLITTVSIEQVLVIAAGMALGTWMGGRLGATIIPFLGHDDFGGQVVPPFVIEINWGALILTYGAMLAVFTAIMLGIVWFIHRISLQRILRIGEM